MSKKARRKRSPQKRAKWEQTETGIMKRWRTPDGTPATLILGGRTLDGQRIDLPEEKPRRRRKPKDDLSDVPF